MGRKITLFRFDVEPGTGRGERTQEEHVTVERPAEYDDGDQKEGGGSLVRRLLVGALLLAGGAVGGFVFRGTAAGRNAADAATAKLPFVGGDEDEGAADERGYRERGASTLVGFAFLVVLTSAAKRAYGTGPLDPEADA